MQLRTKEEADINITSMIDCLMQCIIFFMVIMSAQYIFGVAIKFPSAGKAAQQVSKEEKKEKYITVYISADQIDTGHTLIYPGMLKINGEEIPMVTNDDRSTWAKQYENAYNVLKGKMKDLIDKGYKKEMLMVQGEMKTYHLKTMQVIDIGKDIGMDGFSLVPPER
jgi:hypothetical protein